MSSPAITATNLSKRYRLGRPVGYSTIRDSLATLFSRPKEPLIERDFWALKDVCLEVQHGEVLGIIGRNGAGKSTLLKILSRITEPTAGTVEINGRVGSLLEVGTGFHPELTGRENIFLNGAILGMSKSDIIRKFDDIVEFAEGEKFIDTPIKHYSSGMQMRLAFAVAAHLEPEILLVDEVLAVGDAEFQRKCMGKMSDVVRGGRTIVFVSHNLAAISQLCQRVLWIDAGGVHKIGGPHEVVSAYLQSGALQSGHRPWLASDRPGDATVQLVSVTLKSADGRTDNKFDVGESFFVEIEYEIFSPLKNLSVNFWLTTGDGIVVLAACDTNRNESNERVPGLHVSRCEIPAFLFWETEMLLSVSADIPFVQVVFREEQILSLSIMRTHSTGIVKSNEPWSGLIYPFMKWHNEIKEK